MVIDPFAQFYNKRLPHSALGAWPPAVVRRECADIDNITPRLTA